MIWVAGETSRRLFAAARERNLPGEVPVRVPAPEHLVEMKVKAIRSRPARVLRDGEDLRVLLGLEGSIRMPLVEPSPWPDSSSSGSACVPEPLPDDAFVVSSEVAEALERNRPGPMTLEEYASFVR